MNRRLICTMLIVAISLPVFEASSQTLPPSARGSLAALPELICTTCGTGGDGGGSPPPSPPQTGKITLFNVSPQNRTVEIRDSTGLVVIINPQANRVSFSRSGRSSQISFTAALQQWSGGDSSKAAAMRARLQTLLANPKNTSMLAPSVASQNSVRTSRVVRPNNGLQANLMMGAGGRSFPCDIDFDCDVIDDHGFGGWGSFDFGFWADAGGGGSSTPDYNYWHNWQQDHCGSATHEAWQAVTGYAAVIGTCATAETGLGAIACGGALIATADVMASHDEDSAICNSTYPGAGNWGG